MSLRRIVPSGSGPGKAKLRGQACCCRRIPSTSSFVSPLFLSDTQLRHYVTGHANVHTPFESTNSMDMSKFQTTMNRLRGERSKKHAVVERTTEAPANATFIGIDLGTTNSCITYIDEDTQKVRVIPSPGGSWVHPTIIGFDKDHGIRLYAEEARMVTRGLNNNAMVSGKRLIGRRQGELAHAKSTFRGMDRNITHTRSGLVGLEIHGRIYAVVHMIAMFLRYLKNVAEDHLQRPVTAAVISVPAHFSLQQKVSTEDAALIAGFDVMEIIDEPSAACLAFAVLSRDGADADSKTTTVTSTSQQRTIVFDLGGGTLDVALMTHPKDLSTLELISSAGDELLGGNDWDNEIREEALRQFTLSYGVDANRLQIGGQETAMESEHRHLLHICERCKIHFTNSREPFVHADSSFVFSERHKDVLGLRLEVTLSRYCEITEHLRDRALHVVRKVLAEARLRPQDIDNVLLVGAMTRDPPLRLMLEEYFKRKITDELSEVCPADYAVGIGCAVRAGMLRNVFPELTQKTNFVHGSAQERSQRGLSDMARALIYNARMRFAGIDPRSIGTRYRGIVKGLSEDEIEKYAMEIVEHEVAGVRRKIIEHADGLSTRTCQEYLTYHSTRQGMVPLKLVKLYEEVRHLQQFLQTQNQCEEELLDAVTRMRSFMDYLQGQRAPDGTNNNAVNVDGKVDFMQVMKYHEDKQKQLDGLQRQQLADAQKETDEMIRGFMEEGMTRDEAHAKCAEIEIQKLRQNTYIGPESPGDMVEGKYQVREMSFTSDGSTKVLDKLKAPPKIIRREAPLPIKDSTLVQHQVEHGDVRLGQNDPTREMHVQEEARRGRFADYVKEKAAIEPDAPPGEVNSWKEVQRQLDQGVDIGGLQMAEGESGLEELNKLTMDEQTDFLVGQYLPNFKRPTPQEVERDASLRPNFEKQLLRNQMSEYVSSMEQHAAMEDDGEDVIPDSEREWF